MFDSIQKAVSSFTAKPLPFITVASIHLLTQMLLLFSVAGLFLIIFFTASLARITIDSTMLMAIAAILGIIFLYFVSGIKGAAFKAYHEALNNRKFGFFQFYDYVVKNSGRYFGLFLARAMVAAVPIGIMLAAYYFLIKRWPIPYLDIIVGIISAGVLFLVYYLFYGSFISASLYDTNLKASLKKCFRYIKSAHIFALILYAAYAIIWLTQFIPIINLVTLFVTFPIAYTSMDVYFEKMSGTGGSGAQKKQKKEQKEESGED